MIRVSRYKEPDDFDRIVRQRGADFLAKVPNPTTNQYRSHAYWRDVKDEFHMAYNSVCAYSSFFIEHTTGNDTVEHFLTKANRPDQAYEWNNYRLVCGKLNNRKGLHVVLDPFEIQDGWFLIKFPALLVYPNPELDRPLIDDIIHTINILKLNHEGDCIKSRYRHISNYCMGKYGLDHLMDEAPFLAKELIRQGIQETIKVMWASTPRIGG